VSRTRRALAAALAALALTMAGCAETSAPRAADAEPGATRYPLTVENCGEKVVFDAPPERVILLESAAVTILDGLGVLDRVVARAGSFPDGYYDADLTRRIEGITSLSDDIDASGHLTMSTEVVLAHEPDLALGLPEGITREALRDGGVNTLVQPVYCTSGESDASFGTLYEQIRMFGAVFDRADEAQAIVNDLESRVTAVEDATADAALRTAAVLYPSIGGGPLYAYGRASMSQPQLEAAGFENVFADTAERVFEVSIEELIARDPDILVLLHQGDADGAVAELARLPGSEALRAVQQGDVLPQLFNFTEPPTPLSVTGLEKIVEWSEAGS
uniref:ABC transporter substrate-binding protein n=1 Tax=Microbacterium sp. CPCC 204701 TaxID=2493084 RepID=UPI00315897FA